MRVQKKSLGQEKKLEINTLDLVHVGPDRAAKGGIAASIALLEKVIAEEGATVSCISTVNPDFGSRLWVYFIAILKLAKRLILNKPDLVHIHMASRGSFIRKSIICLLCLFFRTPYLIHLHGGGFRDFYDALGAQSKSYLRFIFKKSAVVITLSEYWRGWVRTELTQGPVVVVHNGTQRIEFSPGELNKKIPTVLFLGRLGENKGTDTLIKAMQAVKAKIPGAVLELCGNGDLEFYKSQARDLPNIKFFGWINDSERRAALARATVYCLPSWKEGLPFSILEAMSAGLPVISTPVGSIPEAITHGVNGYLVPPGDPESLADAIISVLKDPSLASRMGAAGKEIHSVKFSISIMKEGCLSAYSAAINRG